MRVEQLVVACRGAVSGSARAPRAAAAEPARGRRRGQLIILVWERPKIVRFEDFLTTTVKSTRIVALTTQEIRIFDCSCSQTHFPRTMDFSFRVRLQNPCRAARMGILYKPSLLQKFLQYCTGFLTCRNRIRLQVADRRKRRGRFADRVAAAARMVD